MHDIQKRQKKNGEISYTARIRVKGYPPITATFSKKSSAVLWIQKYESDMKEGKNLQTVEAKKHTVSDLIERFEQKELPKRIANAPNLKNHLNWWSKNIGTYALNLVTPALITEFKEKLESEQIKKPRNGNLYRSPATVNRYLATLSTLFSYACKEYGWLDENPMHKVRKNKEVPNKDRYLTEDEIERLLNACKTFNLRYENYNNETYLFVLIALSTGARYSEIRTLKWEHVDLKNKQFYFLNTKNGENRGVPITDLLCDLLKEFRKVRNINSDYLFTTKDGKKLIDMHTRFYKAIEVAKIKNCRFHDLRHNVASYIAMNGGSLLDIAQITGHKTMQMVKRYSHLTQKHTANLLQSTTDIMLKRTNKNNG